MCVYLVAVYVIGIPTSKPPSTELVSTGRVIRQEPKISDDTTTHSSVVASGHTLPPENQRVHTGTTSVTGTEVASPGSLGEVFGSGGSAGTGSLALYSTGSYHLYHNESLGYSFAFPNYAYYQGYGAQAGAAHTMAIGLTASAIENLQDAPVQVYFYKKTPENPPSDNSVVVPQGIVYVVASGAIDTKLKNIIDTIIESAE